MLHAAVTKAQNVGVPSWVLGHVLRSNVAAVGGSWVMGQVLTHAIVVVNASMVMPQPVVELGPGSPICKRTRKQPVMEIGPGSLSSNAVPQIMMEVRSTTAACYVFRG